MATVDIGYRSDESWYSSNRSSKRIVLRGFIVQWERRDEVIVSGVYCGVLFELDFIFFWAILGDCGVQWVGSELVINWLYGEGRGKRVKNLVIWKQAYCCYKGGVSEGLSLCWLSIDIAFAYCSFFNFCSLFYLYFTLFSVLHRLLLLCSVAACSLLLPLYSPIVLGELCQSLINGWHNSPSHGAAPGPWVLHRL